MLTLDSKMPYFLANSIGPTGTAGGTKGLKIQSGRIFAKEDMRTV